MLPSPPPEDMAQREQAIRQRLDCRAVRRQVARIRGRMLCGKGRHASTSACGSSRRGRTQCKVFPSRWALPPLVPDEAATVAEHLAHVASVEHPAAQQRAELPEDAEEAVQWIAHGLAEESAHALIARRESNMRVLRKAAKELAAVNASIEPFVLDSVRAMPQRVDVALLHVLAAAVNSPDLDVAIGYALGYDPVGDVWPSGWWPVKVTAATMDFAETDNDAWVARASAKACTRAEHAQPLWDATMAEVEKGLVHGPFTKSQLDTAFGVGQWRPMVRFAVLQGAKLRPCDDAKKSGSNKATSTFESLLCDTPDFPARVCMAFHAAARERGCAMPEMAGGTEDLSDAYRHVPTSDMRFTCFVQRDPCTGRAAFFTMPGFNFGLKSAVLQFNRYPELVVAVARRLFAIVCTHFYDDFTVVEPRVIARRAQEMLGEITTLLGLPFSERKRVWPAAVLTFLGVVSDMSAVQSDEVAMHVSASRVEKLVTLIDEMLDDRHFPSSSAKSLCGKLQFTLSWVACRFGRAAMQPLFAEREGRLTPAVRDALRFFAAVLPLLQPHTIRLSGPLGPPALVLSDGACEDGGVRQEVGFLVAIPRDGAPCPCGRPSLGHLRRWYDLYHGSAPVSEELKEALVYRKQQIGQDEIIGALAPYLSLPRLLAGRDVIHWVDNTSAIAALTKGYSGRPDSARLVHALHAWCAMSRTSIWFEYVPSAANAADEPSRDMRLACALYHPAPGLCSTPVRLVLPSVAGLADIDAWTHAARWARGL